MKANSNKPVYEGMTYRQVCKIWNTHYEKWVADRNNPKLEANFKHWDTILTKIELDNDITITVNDVVKKTKAPVCFETF